MTMISAEDRTSASPAAATNNHHATPAALSPTSNHQGATSGIPRCVCGWKNCRVYQKAFHGHYEVWDGVIKLKFCKGDPESMALKSSIDRLLKVDTAKRNDYKTVKSSTNNNSTMEVAKYTIARHHFTEKHLQKAETTEGYSFLKPFTAQGAKKYLHCVDERDTLSNDHGDLFYVQAPNNSKEVVKSKFCEIKERLERRSNNKEDPRDSEQQQDATTVATERSNKQQQQELLAKEQENAKLKDQLEAMQSQLTFLHDMVKKLQEDHLDRQSVRSGRTSVRGGGGGGGGGGSVRQYTRSSHRESTHSRSRRTISSRSGRSGVPHEIELGEDGDGENRSETGDSQSQWNENDWSAHGPSEADYESRGGGSRHYRGSNDGDDTTVATFRRQRVSRRHSNSSAVSRTSRATSIVSASPSVKKLPREIELNDDEDDSESHESLEEEAFDNRSMASNWRTANYSDDDDEDEHRHGEEKKGDYPSEEDAEKYGYGPSAMGGQRPSIGLGHRKPSRRSSVGASPGGGESETASRRSSLASHLSKSDNKSVTFDPDKENQTEISSLTAGTYQVQALVVTDPYGEQGTYTGSISNSTNMPHGYGRLEYDRAGRWYEGDWKHGRWTGKGRLSNGDGDFYEGGLKNDHKHGHGIMKFADGRIFEGEYINGQMIEGKMTYQDGSTYTGSWVDGMRHGRGRCVFTDNSIYEGEFREGEFFGQGKMCWSDGGWYSGNWVYGEMDGYGKEVRPDGSLRHEGEWRKGQPIRKPL